MNILRLALVGAVAMTADANNTSMANANTTSSPSPTTTTLENPDQMGTPQPQEASGAYNRNRWQYVKASAKEASGAHCVPSNVAAGVATLGLLGVWSEARS